MDEETECTAGSRMRHSGRAENVPFRCIWTEHEFILPGYLFSQKGAQQSSRRSIVWNRKVTVHEQLKIVRNDRMKKISIFYFYEA